MKHSQLRPVTRMFPIGTAGYNSRWLATLLAGTSLMGATAARATIWDGSTSTDWNDPTNWVGDNGTGGSNAEININAPRASISANLVATPVDILVGNGGGTMGRLDHTAGTAATGAGNWMLVGRQNGGTGIYNLANTAATGGTLTGYGLGSGTMNVGSATGTGGRLYVGGANYAGSIGNGTVNVNTTGTLSIKNDLAIGSAGGTGVVNFDAGTITTGGWNFFGKVEGDVVGGVGTFNMSGGTMTNTGRQYVGQGNTTGRYNQSGGTYNNNGEFSIGSGNLDNADFSTLVLTGGTLNSGKLSLGGEAFDNAAAGKATGTISGTAVLNVNGEFWVGQTAGSVGRMTVSSGTVSVNNWIAVGRAGADGTLTISGTGLVQKDSAGSFEIGNNAGSTGLVNLDGGTLRVDEIVTGGGNSTFNFNGGRLKAVTNAGNFMQGLTNAFIKAGGAVVDTDGFNVAINQLLQDDANSTGGVITKTGAGILTLGGANTYTGAEAVMAGTLMVTTDVANSTNVTVANGAGYGVVQAIPNAQVARNNVTFGTTGTSTVTLDLGNFGGNTTAAPLKVNGTLRLNGAVSVNIIDLLPEVGTFPLIAYTGAKAGTGNFVLGTLPNGVVATLTDSGGVVSLVVTSVALPYWNATASNIWDTTTTNWINLVGGAPTTYKNGNPVLFNDATTGPGGESVLLNSTVTPASVTFNNSTLAYSLSGTGKISGTTGLLKQGTSTLNINTLNDYTGVTTFEGGNTVITTLGNGSAASAIGSAAPAPANLVFNGGFLEYTGTSTTTNRGLTVSGANSGLTIANNLTVSGPIVSTGGSLIKGGAGNLTLTNPGNVIGIASVNPALRVAAGTLTLEGAGTQINQVRNEMWVGNTPDVPAAVVLNNTSLNVGGWIAVGRGNGSTGTLSTLSATNSTITSANVSTGFDGGIGGNDSDQTITLNNSTWTNNGQTLWAESLNSTTNVFIRGTSHFQANGQLLMGLGQDSVVNLTIENSGRLTKTGGWLAIGNSSNGTANVTVKDSGRLSANGDFNIGDVGTSTGTLNIQGSAVVSSTDTAFIGKNTGTTGNVIQTSGTFNNSSWITIGRFTGSTGTVNVSGGTFNQTGTGQALIVGEEGTGTLTISGTGMVTCASEAVIVSSNDNPDTVAGAGTGTVNLNAGGILVARRIIEGGGGAGIGTINFNGGLLRVGANPNADYLNGLDAVNVLAGGANIDTNGSNIAIAQTLQTTQSSGGLTKTGAGTLQLNGTNTYTGTTTVSAGTLGGTGAIAGPLVIAAGTTIAPGAGAPGTFTVGGATTLSGTYAVEIDGGANDTLSVTGSLNVSTATLAITTLAGGSNQPAYVIANYTGAVPAPFASVTGLPAGYALNYAYNNGTTSTNIAIVSATVPAAFAAWIATFFPGATDPAVIGPAADPDKDGESNALEFALGGLPNSGSNHAKIYSLALDSDADADTTRELLLTIAVRTATPAFSGSPAPGSTLDGFTVRVEGGSLLNTFPTVVNPVGAVTTGLPAVPAGYQYRTFSLAGSNGLPGKGFLRAKVSF